MSGLVARRNDPRLWGGVVTWVRLRNKTLPVCGDCLINIHEHGGAGDLGKGRWRRVVVDGSADSVVLCERHKREWEHWTPGQLELAP